MNKISLKRIIGLFIFALIITVFSIKSVNAESCTKVLNELNDNDVQLKRYGLKIDYDKDIRKYIVKSDVPDGTIKEFKNYNSGFKKSSIKFKIGGLYFYEASEDKDYEKNLLKNYIDSGANASKVINVSANVENYKNNGLISKTTLNAKDEFTIGRDILSGVVKTHSGIAVKLVPDGFNDPRLVAACGPTSKLYMMVYTSVEAGEEEVAIEISGGDSGSSGSTILGQINCSSPKNEFEKNFCIDKAAAMASSTTRKFQITGTKTDVKTKAEMIKYEKIGEQLKKVTDPLVFQCNYKDTVTGIPKNDDEYYVNKKYIYGEGKVTVSLGDYKYTGEYTGGDLGKTNKTTASCELQCEEVVKVEYGPPVASKAGLCFEYKVKVTSRVDCYTVKEPTPPPKQYICTPTPWCNHPGGYPDHQGGPDEDFDECINKCDGGLYSDRCSNKCYKQVYGESLVRKTAGTEIEYADGKKVDRSKLLYQYKVKNGKVYWDVGASGDRIRRYEIDSKGNKSYPAGPGGPKQHSHASRDVITDSYWHKHHDWGYPTSYYYYYDKTGIPKIDNCSSTKCWWEANSSAACTNKNNYRYLNHPSVYTDRYGTKYPGVSAQEQDKKVNQKLYDDLKAACAAYSSCNTTTAEFTISVDYTEKGKTEVKTINFPYSNDKKNTITNTENSVSCEPTKDSILLSYNGCYNCGKSSEKDWYMTEWSFPGTWIHIKTGQIVYNPTTIYDSSWRSIENKFCLPLNIGDVNQKWYNYYQKKVNGSDTSYSYNNTEYMNSIVCPDGKKLTNPCDYTKTEFTDSDKIDYNINASTRNFGMFEWDINIQCFYAVNSQFPKVNESDKCESSCIDDGTKMRVRTVDLNNLFPDKEGNKLTSTDKTGRTPGFNWTSFANQTTKDTDYKSVPSNYTKWIQAKGTSIYSDEYLDYEVNLTKEIISELKKQVNNDMGKKYTNWQGNTEVNSVTNYESPLFRNGGILSTNSKYPRGDAITCNNMKNYASTECEDFTEEGK